MSDDEQKTSDQKPTTSDQGQGQGGILANDHDVDKLNEEIGKLLQGLAQRGVVINLDVLDLGNLKARIEGFAACKILVEKGVCTEAEMAATCNREFRALLAIILQRVEEQIAASQGPRQDKIIAPRDGGRKIQVAKPPKLAVVRH